MIDSTQEELRRRLLAGADIDRLVIRAREQTIGQGRRGDEWRSAPGGSYQSFAVRDDQGHLRAASMPLELAVAIARALHDRGVEIALKWPNDLHLRPEASASGPFPRLPGKVGGILCHYLRNHLLVGVGLNVRNEVPAGTASLSEFEPDEVSDLVLGAVERAIHQPDPRTLPERFRRFDPLVGRTVRFRLGERELLGRYDGVTPEGCLRLRSAAGTTELCDGRIVEIDAAA